MLLTHLEQVSYVAAHALSHVDAGEGCECACTLVFGSILHCRALGACQICSRHSGIPEGCALLQFFDALLVLVAGLDGADAKGNHLDAAEIPPLCGKLLVQALGQLCGVAGEGAVLYAHVAYAGEGGLQCGHHLGAHLGVYAVPGVAVGDVAAYVLVEQHGVGYLIGIFAEALYGYLKLQPRAYVVIYHAEGDGVGGAVLVADYLLGVEVIDTLVLRRVSAEGEALLQYLPGGLEVVAKVAVEYGRLGGIVPHEFSRLRRELHYGALLYDHHALALVYGDNGAVGDDVVLALGVGVAAARALYALGHQDVLRHGVAVEVFAPLIGQYAAQRAYSCL